MGNDTLFSEDRRIGLADLRLLSVESGSGHVDNDRFLAVGDGGRSVEEGLEVGRDDSGALLGSILCPA